MARYFLSKVRSLADLLGRGLVDDGAVFLYEI